jgi:DedD protein
MAFFKLRFPGRNASSSTGADAISNTPAESVEVIRKRARHRLMGSVVLVLGAVVGLPLLFDSQPRPVAVDTPIVIPDRNQATPLVTPAAKSSASKDRGITAPGVSLPDTMDAKNVVANASALDPHEEVVTKDNKSDVAKSEVKTAEAKVEQKSDVKIEAKPEAKSEPKSESKSEAKPETKAESKAETKTAGKTDSKSDPKHDAKTDHKTDHKSDKKSDTKSDSKDAAKVKALLDGKEATKSEAVRSVVQVGAFADAAKAKEARNKLESAGIKTYTQEVDTKEGKRIRVRVGPFATKEEADKAAEKIRKLNLQTSVIKL